MESAYILSFLGTGGGRFATLTQKRRTAGIRIIGSEVNLHLDPGPGALVYSVQTGLNPQKLNSVVVSHCHPDHYTDAEILIEAMTHGNTQKRGILAASRSALRGSEDELSRVISGYHQSMPEQVIEAIPEVNFEVANLKIEVTKAKHTDPYAVGFRFKTAEFGDFAYTSDTEYFEDMNEYYKGVRLLILCVLRPEGKPWIGHMTTNDAIRIIEEVDPQMAILTHFGIQMILKGPASEAKKVEERTGINTIAAADNMRIIFGNNSIVQADKAKIEKGLPEFF